MLLHASDTARALFVAVATTWKHAFLELDADEFLPFANRCVVAFSAFASVLLCRFLEQKGLDQFSRWCMFSTANTQ